MNTDPALSLTYKVGKHGGQGHCKGLLEMVEQLLYAGSIPGSANRHIAGRC